MIIECEPEKRKTKSRLVMLFAFAVAGLFFPSPSYAAGVRVSEEEFESAFSMNDFTSSWRMRFGWDGRTMANVNGYGECDGNALYCSFNVSLDGIASAVLTSYYGKKLDGNYSILAGDIEKLKRDIGYRSDESSSQMLVKMPDSGGFVPVNEVLPEFFKDFSLQGREGTFRLMVQSLSASLADQTAYYFDNGEYVREFSFDSGLEGSLSWFFSSDKRLASGHAEGKFPPSLLGLPFDGMSIAFSIRMSFSKINGTTVSVR